jgi:hypothetical protein
MYIPEAGEACWNCAYYEHGMDSGECRRNAPIAWLQRAEKEFEKRLAFWPNVDLTDWCGEMVDAPASRARQRDAREAGYQELRDARAARIKAEAAESIDEHAW